MRNPYRPVSLLVPVVFLWACELGPPAAPTSPTSPTALESSAVVTAPIQSAAPAAAGSKQQVAYAVDAVIDGGPYGDPTWVSTRPGATSKTTLFAKWTGDAIVITPTGSPYALTDDAQMSVRVQGDRITGLTLYIQDVAGTAGIQHETDAITLDAPVQPSSAGFTLHVHRDRVPVYRLKGHTGGPRVGTIGTISVGDLVYRPTP